MIFEVGKYEYGNKIFMPWKYLKNNPSVKGHKYEIVMKLDRADVDGAMKLAKVLPKELYRRYRAKLTYLGIGKNFAILQIQGSPFEWPELLMFLPQIFEAVGFIITAISVLLIARTSTAELFALFVGLSLLYWGLKMQGKEKEVARKVIKTAEKVIE